MKKPVKIGLAAAIALPIVVAAAIPLFVDANTFRPVIESRLSAALSRKVTLGALSLSVMTGSLVAKDLAIAEDPKFGQPSFFTAKRLRIGVQMKPLIFNRQLIVRSFELDGPEIHLFRLADGTWNFSTLGHGADSQNITQRATLPDLPVGLITIKDGNARIETLPLERNPQVYEHLNVKLEHFSLAKPFPFTVRASLPGDGKVGLSGTVGPVNPQDAASTTFDARVTIEHLDPVIAGYIDPAAGISMIAGLDVHIVSDGRNVTSEGKIHAEHLILLKGGKAAPYPLDIDYQVGHSLAGNSGQVSDLALHTGAVAIHIKGTYQLAANESVFDLKLLAHECSHRRPAGPYARGRGKAAQRRGPQGGNAVGSALTSRARQKTTSSSGSYEIKNTKLEGYNLGSKIVGIAALGGIKTGDTTAIDISRADVRITKAGSESTNIYSVLPALGESTGSGTVSPSGELNFHLISKVTSARGLNKLGVNLLTKLNSTSAGAKPSTANGIPINITGTAENPVITADVSGLMKGNAATLRSKGAAILNKIGRIETLRQEEAASFDRPAKLKIAVYTAASGTSKEILSRETPRAPAFNHQAASFARCSSRCSRSSSSWRRSWEELGSSFLTCFSKALQHRAAHVGFDHAGMHIALAADRGRVAQALGDRGDGLHHVLLGLGLRLKGFKLAQHGAGQHGAGPGAKVLGGKLLLGDRAQIFVDVGGIDAVVLAVFIEILE